MGESARFSKLLSPLMNSKFFDLKRLDDARLQHLPLTIRILLEAAVRNCDEFLIHSADVEAILDWERSQGSQEVPFVPARVLMQDLTGVPAVVDLAAMRDCVTRLGGDALRINPVVPVDLVVDHSIQLDAARSADARAKNEAKEFSRNKERFAFLKWGSAAFKNLRIVPPGNGIVHQVNLEYLAHIAFQSQRNGLLYPDTLVGTDSHTTMINGVGCLGWGVGGIEAEAAMLGQPIRMVLPKVVGVELLGRIPVGVTATDAVLTITKRLREFGVVGMFVEFFGGGMKELSVADRATISNMAPEYGATCGFFPIDQRTVEYLRLTGRGVEKVEMIERYAKLFGLWAEGGTASTVHFSATLQIDLAGIIPCIAGPKRPHDVVPISVQKEDFVKCVTAKTGFKGFGVAENKRDATATLNYNGCPFEVRHGHIVMAAITSCTNTSNPAAVIASGLLARKALEKGLRVRPYIKTSLSPGSRAVESYLQCSGLLAALESLGFFNAGYGCMTCIGNSGELDPAVYDAFAGNGLIAASVLSGNRNFEGRIHPNVAANYLASPSLVVAFAIAGSIAVDLALEPLGVGSDGKNVFLKDVWPCNDEVDQVIRQHVTQEIYGKVYADIWSGNEQWNSLEAPMDSAHYPWDAQSTYIHNPPFFQSVTAEVPPRKEIRRAACLLLLGDSVTTDHISPAGSIVGGSPAAKYLESRNVSRADFSSYGARRGNDLVMVRGTFANPRISNQLAGSGITGPVTLHHPSGAKMAIFDASQQYLTAQQDLIIIAGRDYGSGSSRDWAAKGTRLLGVKAVLAESFERIHRSNLVGMGILPLCFQQGESAQLLGITGTEEFDIDFGASPLLPTQAVTIRASGKTFTAVLRLDTPAEIVYYTHGGILPYVIRTSTVTEVK